MDTHRNASVGLNILRQSAGFGAAGLMRYGVALSIIAWASVVWADVQLGVAGPMSGVSAVFGTQVRNGASLAVADINRTGGILGQKIRLVVGDDRSDARQAIVVANSFVQQRVAYVVGHVNSATSIPASRVYLEHDILMVTPTAVSPQVTEKGRWNVFRVSGRDDRQAEVAGAYIVAKLRERRVAFLHDKSASGRDFADQTRKFINDHGMNEVATDSVEAEAKDYAAAIAKLKAARAEVVFWGGGQREAAALIRQLRDAGSTAVLMGGDALMGNDLAATLGDRVVGTLMTFPPDYRHRPEAAAVIAEIRARYGDPLDYSLSSYAAVQVLQQAAAKAGSLDAAGVAAAMRSGVAFATVIGAVAFDKNGDVTRPDYVVFAWVKDPDGALRVAPMAP